MTSASQKSRFGLTSTPLIPAPHGAGGRSIGFGSEIAHYDYTLLSGVKVRDRTPSAGLIRADNHYVVGYPKFDSVALDERAAIFANASPTVLYNPHCEPHLSSWYRMGHEVVAWDEQALVRFDSPEYYTWRYSKKTFRAIARFFYWGEYDARFFAS